MSQDAKEVFLKAVELADPQQRVKLLDHVCSDNPELRRRVDALLQAHDEPGSFMEEPPAELAKTYKQTQPISEKPGTTIGPYKLLQQIGEGGFGIVYMAEQAEPIRRKVALKIIKPGMDTKDVIARFEAERQALALMDHPNIARVFDAGATEQGRPYFVMELVKGIPLIKFCDENKLSVEERLKLFVTICRAIQHAHQKGIIHRDVKPSNIMITMHDGEPIPKVIDFGVSKALSQQLTEKTLFTAYGQMIGTPVYMSPEQAEMSGLDVDTRSDIYSLGVLLYELLTGSTPITAERLRKSGYAEMQKLIREEEPEKPSLRLSTLGDATASIATKRGVEPKRLSAFVRGDLDWIVMKALEKNRDRRYETASNFASDIDRFLKHEAVEASPPSARYKLRKYIQKNKTALSIMATISTILSVATFISTLMVIQAVKAEDKLKESLARETIAREYAEGQKERADAQRQKADMESRRANEALKETRKTIDKYVETVQNAELLKEERFKPLLKELLKDAMAHYMNFIDNHEHDAAELHDLATALYRVALNSDLSGNTENALNGYLKVIRIWKELITESPTVPTFRHNLAKSRINIGIVYQNTGKLDEALQSYQMAFEILETLSSENPMVTIYRFNLGKCQHNIGRIYSVSGKPHEAKGYLLKAVEIREKLVQENPTFVEYRNDLAKDLNVLAITYQNTGNPDEALRTYQRALIIHEKLVAQNPKVTEYRDELANTHLNIGVRYNRTGNLDKALESYQNSLSIREKLVKENPTVTAYLMNLSVNHHNIAILHEVTRKPNEALLSNQKIVAIQEKLVKDFPQSISHAIRLGGSYVNTANLEFEIKDYITAIQHYDSGVKTLSQVVFSNSEHQTARFYLRNAHLGRASLMQQLERFEEAVTDWEKVIEYDSGQMQSRFRTKLSISLVGLAKTEKYKIAFDEALRLAKENKKQRIFQYNMAYVASSACESANNDKALAAIEKAELTSQYSKEAISLLKTAKTLGFFKDPEMKKLIQTDKDLDAIRDHAGFEKLLKEIAGDSPAKQDKKREKKTDLNNKDEKPLFAPRPKLVAPKPGG